MGTPAAATLALVLSPITEVKYHRRTHESNGYERYTLEAPGACWAGNFFPRYLLASRAALIRSEQPGLWGSAKE